MSDRDNFEAAYKEKFGDGPEESHDLTRTLDGYSGYDSLSVDYAWWAWQAALEHCKQGDSERFKSWMEETFSPDSDVLKVFSNQKPFLYLRMRDGNPDWSEDCVSEDYSTLLENGGMVDGEYSVLPLFTHAMPNGVDNGCNEIMRIRLAVNEIIGCSDKLPQSVRENAYLIKGLSGDLLTAEPIAEVTKHGIYGIDKNTVFKVGTKLFTTPQPFTDISELLTELTHCHADLKYIRVQSFKLSGFNEWLEIRADKVQALIAKHTVK